MSVSGRTPVVWAIHDGKIGMANQVLGLAEAVGFPVVEKAVALRSPWRHLVPPLWIHPMAALKPEGARLEPPWPDLLVSCGRGVIALALAVKRMSRGRTLWMHPMAALKPEGARLEPPWPDLLVSCGRGVIALALAVKRMSRGRTLWVHVQD